jgi:hypothetical protein
MPPTRPKRKTNSIYDAYRMVRPPRPLWDSKCAYRAIGKVPGAAYDDVFLLSALNHHVSLVRARVPLRLLDELGGETETAAAAADGPAGGWGEFRFYRSRWYDLFLVEERIEAMTAIWGMMSWLMRDPGVRWGAVEGGGETVPMDVDGDGPA